MSEQTDRERLEELVVTIQGIMLQIEQWNRYNFETRDILEHTLKHLIRSVEVLQGTLK